MLTLEQLRILRVLNRMRKLNQAFSQIEFEKSAKIPNKEKLYALCESLDEQGYFKFFAYNLALEITQIALSYKGMTYIQVIVMNFMKKTFIWLSDHIIELAALILSVIALLRTLQQPY